MIGAVSAAFITAALFSLFGALANVPTQGDRFTDAKPGNPKAAWFLFGISGTWMTIGVFLASLASGGH